MSADSSSTQTNSSPPLPPIIPITSHQHLPIRLTTSNFPSWRAHLLALLQGFNLAGHLDGTITPPLDDDAPSPAYTRWFQQDKLLAAVFGSLSDDILPLVSTASTAADAWDTLTRLFASKSSIKPKNMFL